jgi:hypothetical protein
MKRWVTIRNKCEYADIITGVCRVKKSNVHCSPERIAELNCESRIARMEYLNEEVTEG